MTIKNEWPLAAVSISHALINTVDEMYVVDNGSQDGTWQGLKILQEIFPNRIIAIYFKSEPFNQKAVTHALSHLVATEENQQHWGIFLDADEFTIWENSVPFPEFLRAASLDWNSIYVDLVNFIPPLNFKEDDLNLYGLIRYRANGRFANVDEESSFKNDASSGLVYWQDWTWHGKVIAEKKVWKRLGYGGHQIEYGDGSWGVRHDSKTAGGSRTWGLFRAHLPYTSLRRLQNRSRLNHADKRGNGSRFFMSQSTETLRSYFSNMTIDEESKLFVDSVGSGKIELDLSFSKSIESVIPVLESRWEEIISAPHVVAETDVYNFASLVEMSVDYILLADKLWMGGGENK